jgi:hypothetical protein
LGPVEGDRFGVESLRLRLRSSRDSRKRVPEEVPAEAVAFASAAHVSGERYKSIASTLGLKPLPMLDTCPFQIERIMCAMQV